MKIYKLDGVINSKELKTKMFASRDLACMYLDKLLYKYDLQVNYIRKSNHNHNQQYVCSNYSMISINRDIVTF